MNSTVLVDSDPTQEIQLGDMSIDGSLIDKESPPHFVTHRKGANSDMQDLRAELKTFQSSMVFMLESWFTKQDDKFSRFIDDFREIKTSIRFINDKFEDLTAKADDVSKRVATLENGAATIQHNSSRIVNLEAKLDVMEQQARQCNIEINNLPEKRGENLTAILEDIATLIKMPVGKQDLVSIHRVPQALATSQRPKNVIVKFSSRLMRDSFVSAVRKHKGITSEQLNISGSSHKIYINEHLTLKNKNLFRQTREAAKQHGFRFVWVKHGSVLVRRNETSPAFSVRCEKDLSKISSQGYNTYTYNDTAHTAREPDEILSVSYEDGKWSKPYYDCGGGNIWMLTYTVPFFGYNGSYFFKGTSGIDIDLRRVDIDQCPLKPGSTQLNIFAGTDKCKKKTSECVPVPGLGFRRGSYRCVCRRGFYFPNTTAENRYYNGSDIEEEYEKHLSVQQNLYALPDEFECLPCAEGCEACVDGSPCVAALNWVLRSSIFALACLITSLLPFIVVFTIKYGHVRVVRAASPALLRVIVLGAFLIYCTTLVMYGRPTVFTCTARVWLREVGFCLTYGALMLKTWRISVIFQVRSAKAVKISDIMLLRRIGVIVGVACVLLAIRTLVAPPAVIVGRTKEDLKAYLCNTDWWDHSFTTLEVIFLMWGIRLCIMVRKAPSEFNESRFISMAIYNEFLLSVFLNISMLFLQSPANPDLLYIIFFCHTQLTVTLLLCFIFGSKAYMVYKGHGKDDREKTGKFRSRPAESTYTMTTNRSARFCDNMTERELEEEFKKICNQLEKLRERCGACAVVSRRITAMQDAAVTDHKKPSTSDAAPLKLNTVFSAVADRLMCTVTPAEESSSSGRDLPFEAPPAYKHKPFSSTKSAENSNAEQSHTDVTTDSPKKKEKDKEDDKQNGVFKISGEPNCSDIRPPEVTVRNGVKSEGQKSPGSTETVKGVRSGHARTHAIVINLDDKSRFTEEVTV